MEITGKRGPEGVVKAVCTSEKKGVEKHSVPEGHFLKNFGIEGDAHAGKWHRQVSLLSYDKVKFSSCRNDDLYRRCGSSYDPDRQRMSQPLCYL